MKHVIAIGALLLVVMVTMPSGQAFNFYGFEDLKYMQPGSDGCYSIPVLSHGGGELYVAVNLQVRSSGMDYTMPLVRDGGDMFVITVKEGFLYIALLGRGMAAPEEFSGIGLSTVVHPDYGNIYVIDMDLDGMARGYQVLLPLLNYPPGTGGYVIKTVKWAGGECVIPLLQAPVGHAKNLYDGGTAPEWNLRFDMAVALDYRIIGKVPPGSLL